MKTIIPSFRSLVCFLLLVCVMPSFAAVRYVKPVACGEANGASWADAFTLADALANAAEDDEIRLAQGVHKVSATATLACKVTLRGGYAGVSEAEEPSGDRTTTIISGDKNDNDVWQQFDPVSNTFTTLTDGSGNNLPVIANGAITVPKTEGRFAVAVPTGCSDDVSQCIKYGAGGSLTAENLTFSGFGAYGTSNTKGVIVYHNVATAVTTMTNCLFIANGNGQGLLEADTGGTLSILDCAFRNNLSNQYGSMVLLNKTETTVVIQDCLFEDLACSLSGCKVPGPVALHMTHYKALVIKDCTFNRVVRVLNNCTDDGRAALLIGFHSSYTKTVSGLTVSNCYNRVTGNSNTLGTFIAQNNNTVLTLPDSVFVDNVSDCSYTAELGETAPRGLVGLSIGGYFTNVKFLRNEVTARLSCETFDMTGVFFAGRYGNGNAYESVLDRCSLVSNRLVVVSDSLKTLYAAPVNTYSGCKVVNSSFFDNEVDVSGVTSEDAEIFASRAILMREKEAATAKYCPHVVCSTFAGSTPGDDVVVVGGAYGIPTSASYVRHSILVGAPGDAAYTGVACDTPGYISVCDSIVRTKQVAVDNVTFTDVETDDPMLAYDATVAALRPTVRVPGVSGLKSVKNVTPTVDQLGAARTENALTCGAVEVAFSDDPVVVVRGQPAVGGDVSLPSQTVSGEAQGVTAVAAEGFTFDSWQDAEGKVVCPDETYVPTDITKDTVVYAVFKSNRKTQWTFDAVEGRGTFAGGETSTTLEGAAGEPVAELPEITAADGWVFTGWAPVPPAAFGTEDATFTAQYMPAYKVAYYDSHATGDGSGESWANAATDLATAFALAGNAVRGEVRVKIGKHVVQKGAVVTCGDVSLIGGFTGEGDARTEDRFATVLCGDVNGDDVYSRSPDGETIPVMGEGLSFNRPPDNTREEYWRLDSTVVSDNAGYLLDYPGAVDSSLVRIEGLTFTGFVHSEQKAAGVLTFGAKCLPTVTNCAFIANRATGYNSGNSSKTGSIVDNTVGGLFTDIEFYRNTGASLASIGSIENGTFTDVIGCKFSNGHNTTADSFVLLQLSSVYARIANCIVEYNYSTKAGYGAVSGRSSGFGVRSAINSTFTGNIVPCAGFARFLTVGTGTNLTFRGNYMTDGRADGGAPSACFLYTGSVLADLLFEGNEFSYGGTQTAVLLYPSFRNAWTARPLAFVGNKVSGGGMTALAELGHVYGTAMFNPLFANNVISATGDGKSTVVALGGGVQMTALCNATIWNNVADYDIYSQHASSVAYLYDTIVWSEARDARFGGLAAKPVQAKNCCLKGMTAEDEILMSGSSNVWNEDPQFASGLKRTETGFPYLQLLPSSPYRKAHLGLPIYSTSAGLVYRSPTDKDGYSIYGSAKNYGARTLLDTDAIGDVREEWKYRLGTVQNVPSGLMLLVR